MSPVNEPSGSVGTARPESGQDSPEAETGSASGRIVVVGASAGGVEALQRVVAGLPSDFRAPMVIVLHVPPTGGSRLPEILGRAGLLGSRHARNGEALEPGTIYVAPPDRHVICSDHRLRVVEGPRENGLRPAIDPLFRSAARAYGDRAIGVVLSGTLDDGTAGTAAIHAAGGVTIAQEPADAICPDMPLNAISGATVDHVVPADAVADLLVDLVGRNPREARPSTIGRGRRSTPTDLVCPECGGVLRQFEENGVFRFHCRVGHNYSPESLYDAQDARLEAALWEAIRSLEESASLARRLARSARGRRAPQTARRFEQREREAAERAALVRSAILTLSDLENTPDVAESEPVASEDDERRPGAGGDDAAGAGRKRGERDEDLRDISA